MARYSLTKNSEHDLKQIARFTTKRWGATKRREYLAQMEDAFQKIAEHPDIGQVCPELNGAPRRYHVGRHYIFYQHHANTIEIIRILHDAMDHKRHL